MVSLAVELLLLVHTGLLAAAFPLSRLCLVVVAAAGCVVSCVRVCVL